MPHSLAGSELAARTGATGDTLKEAGKIHQGLLALESVIDSLVKNKKHVPYKDSNLTRILKDSLGGNSKTTLLVAVSPHIWNRAETVSTLRFAARAKKIKNKAKINKRRTRDQMEMRIRQLEELNLSLSKKLKAKQNNSGTVIQQVNTAENDEKLKEALSEIERLKELLRKKEERIDQMEQDLKSKDDVIDEMNNDFTQKTKSMKTQISDRDDTIDDLQNRLFDNENELRRLTKQLEDDRALQSSFAEHKKQLNNIVNETISDKANSTVSALQELQNQQKEFYKYMKSMQANIDKVYAKQIVHDQKFEDIQNKEWSVVNNYHNKTSPPLPDNPRFTDVLSSRFDDDYQIESYDDDELSERELSQKRKRNLNRRSRLSTSSMIFSPEDLMEDDNNDNKDALGTVVDSMKSYLEKQRTGRMDVKQLQISAMRAIHDDDSDSDTNLDSACKSPINLRRSFSQKAQQNDEFTEDEQENSFMDVKTKRHQSRSPTVTKASSEYSVGKKIDVLDSSYHWYSAQIVDIDVFHKKAFKVHYDGFDDKWNEWIPFKKQFLTAPHKSKSLGYGRMEGGQHVLIATSYGRSKYAKALRSAMQKDGDKSLAEIPVLLQGYLYKRGNWNKDWKKRWFVLRNSNNLYYYESNKLKEHQYRGVIALGNIRKIVAVNNGYSKFSFDIQTPSRVYHFSALNESELKDWQSVLECLMNNSLESIAPKRSGRMDAKLLSEAINTKVDPNRFINKHQESKSAASYRKLTQIKSPSPSSQHSFDYDQEAKVPLHKRGSSVINRVRRSVSNFSLKKKQSNAFEI